MKRNVLLTTMSTLPRSMNTNYYYDAKSGRYCEGLLQTEAGTKMILCGQKKITDIIVIGSDETFNVETDDISRMNLGEYYSSHKGSDTSEFKAYALYRYRIGKFCLEGDSKKPNDDIDETRAAELREIADRILSERGFSDRTKWFDIIAKDERENSSDIFSQLKNAVGNKREEINYIKSYCFGLLSEDMRLKLKRDYSELTIQFIPERVLGDDGERHDNIVDILSAIQRNENDDVNLYVDMQGGSRTDSYVRNAILTILTGDTYRNFNLVGVVATNFEPSYFSSAIVDETDRYMITDLVSAMNAFTQYGKADLIKKYCNRMYKNEDHIQSLVEEMVRIDMSLSICDVDAFSKAVISIHERFNEISSDPVFSLMERLIKDDYKGILKEDGTIDYLAMCRWARKKGFIQQALTIIEAKFPEQIVRDKICYYEKKAKEYYKREYENAPDKEKYLYSDISHLFIRNITLKKKEEETKKGAGLHYDVEPKTADTILTLWKKVQAIRNKMNHSEGKNEDIQNEYDSSMGLIDDFLDCYGKALLSLEKNSLNKNVYYGEDIGYELMARKNVKIDVCTRHAKAKKRKKESKRKRGN